MSVKPRSCLYDGSSLGTFTYLSWSLSAASVSLVLGAALSLPSASLSCVQKPASALRNSSSSMRNSSKVSSLDVTDPVPPFSLRRMLRRYVSPWLTRAPESRTAPAPSTAACAFFSIPAAVSFPTPLVPASGSSGLLHAARSATSPAHNARENTALRARPEDMGAVTYTLPLIRGGRWQTAAYRGRARGRTRSLGDAVRTDPPRRPARGRASLNP